MAGERENARERNIRRCIYTTTLRKIDRMALFIPSHLLLYVRGETAVNSTLFSTFSLSTKETVGAQSQYSVRVRTLRIKYYSQRYHLSRIKGDETE